MKLNVLLIISAVYMAMIGIGYLISPVSMSAGAVQADSSSALVAFLRHHAGLFIAIAVMNWMARNSEASTARNAIVLANLVVYGLGAILDVLAVLGGAPAAGLAPASINLLIAIAFFWVWRKNPS
jgi:hypothetical protein